MKDRDMKLYHGNIEPVPKGTSTIMFLKDRSPKYDFDLDLCPSAQSSKFNLDLDLCLS